MQWTVHCVVARAVWSRLSVAPKCQKGKLNINPSVGKVHFTEREKMTAVGCSNPCSSHLRWVLKQIESDFHECHELWSLNNLIESLVLMVLCVWDLLARVAERVLCVFISVFLFNFRKTSSCTTFNNNNSSHHHHTNNKKSSSTEYVMGEQIPCYRILIIVSTLLGHLK